MTRTVLDQQLQHVSARLLSLGNAVDALLANVLKALRTQDQVLYQQVLEAGCSLDSLQRRLERQVFDVLALQQPLGSHDLRVLTMTLLIARHLRQAGHGAGAIARLLLMSFETTAQGQAADQEGTSIPLLRRRGTQIVPDATSLVRDLLALGEDARQLLRASLQACVTQDAALARQIWQEDDVVDVRYHLVRHDLFTLLADPPSLASLAAVGGLMSHPSALLEIAHGFERVADHGVTICERTVFLVEGVCGIPMTLEPEAEAVRSL